MAALAIDVNKKDNGGWTPLNVAIDNNSKSALAALMEIPAVDWTVKTKDGQSVLDFAR